MLFFSVQRTEMEIKKNKIFNTLTGKHFEVKSVMGLWASLSHKPKERW